MENETLQDGTRDAQAVRAAARLLLELGASRVYTFGSITNGRIRRDSDIDIAVSGLPPRLFFSAVHQASDLIGRPVDLLDLDDDTPFVRYLRDHGELVRVG
jgi:predicted nucleotidyltransferase